MADPSNPFSTGPASNNSFLMPIEDVFHLKNRGVVVTGRIERGMVQVGETVEIVGMKEPSRQVTISELEMFRKLLKVAQAGDNVGCLLKDIQPTDLVRGQVLASIGSIKEHKHFSAQVQMLTKEDGGRHTPFSEGYRPNIRIRSAEVPGFLKLLNGLAMGIPGQSFEVEIELSVPVALEVGTLFMLREAGRTVGNGVCTRLDSAYPY